MLGDIINIGFPDPGQKEDLSILVGDIGGTKTHLAIYHIQLGEFELEKEAKFSSQKYVDLESIVEEFLENEKRPDRFCIGIAGPVFDGYAKLTNLNWEIDANVVRKKTGIDKVYVINDLEANAYGLAGLTKEDILTIHPGTADARGNAVIVSPGTGLGEAGLYWDGKDYHPFATEGGHTDYAPETEDDLKIFKCLQAKYGHVSWERVVSGMGILEIYSCLSDSTVEDVSEKVKEKFKTQDAAAAISMGARGGAELCQKTMQIFLRNLANEAANLVMKLMGTGGVFIGGGIVPKNLDMLQRKEFVGYFLEAGRMSTLLEGVPIHIILNDRTALIGATLYGYYNH